MAQYRVTGMTCAACQAHVEKAVAKVDGVDEVNVSLLTNTMNVEGKASAKEIIEAVEKAGYGASQAGDNAKSSKIKAEEEALKDTQTPILKKRLIWSVVFLIVLMYLSMGHAMWEWPVPGFLDGNAIGLAVSEMLLALIVMNINRSFFVSGFRSLFHLAPNMDTLVALGSSVSFGWSLVVLYEMTMMSVQGTDQMSLMMMAHSLYFESAAMIPALITVGKLLESISKGRTTDALKGLMQMAPKTAVLERNGKEVTVSIDEVAVGDIFVVRPGEAIPVDGIVLEGSSAVDESALTGESIPVDKTVQDPLRAASINQSGHLKARATKVGEDTVFAQIIQMVSDASATKAPIARIADKVSGIFVPAVMVIALAVLIIWLLLGQTFSYALERAISVLVISCPCALGLATPVAIMVGNGVGAKNGILFKTSEALENTGHIQIVAFDKTGTLTEGRPEVTDIKAAAGISEAELLSAAVSLEKQSEHPLAKAVLRYGEAHRIGSYPVNDFMAAVGNGLSAKKDDVMLYGGSLRYIKAYTDIPSSMQEEADVFSRQGKTPVCFARGNELLGMIAIADVMKPDSIEAVKQLHHMGIQTVMITGDNEYTARAIAAEAGIDHVIAGVLPNGKQEAVQQLKQYGKTAMVGDGINDAPALACADVGIAIGAGTDIAMDSADIVLMNSKLTDVSGAVRLSRRTIRNIHENLFWAFAYNALLIPMAAGVYPSIQMSPMWGAAAMSLSSFTVCMNALRLNLVKVHDDAHDHPMKQVQIELHENRTEKKEEKNEMKETVKVEGMMCEMCEKHVKTALEKVDGITCADVSHDKGTAEITCDKAVEDAAVKAAVEEAGYHCTAIEK